MRFETGTKKAVYSEKNNSVSFDTTKMTLAEDDLTLEALQRRQDELRERAELLWLISS